MIVDVIATKFNIDIDGDKLNTFICSKIDSFMEENEYFHEENFLAFLEEDDRCELADEKEKAQGIITLAQLEEWVEDSYVNDYDDEEDQNSENEPELGDDPESESIYLDDEDYEDEEED